MIIPRRRFFAGAAALLAAPAIVRAASIMPVKVQRWPIIGEWEFPPTGKFSPELQRAIVDSMMQHNALFQRMMATPQRLAQSTSHHDPAAST